MVKSFYKYEGDKMMTFIFGHKSPDTDTVCSSIALSYLKNELGDKTVPKVLGNINNETRFVLNYFNVPVPSYLNDVRVRIKNVKYDKKAFIDESQSIDEAFKLMEKHNITAIPLVDDKKVLTGYVTLKELAKYLINGNREQVYTTLDNIIETINAKVIVKCDDIIKGITLIAGLSFKALEQSFELSNEDILIVGDRYKVLDYAIKSKVKLVILPLNINLDKKIIKKAQENGVNIIASELDSFQIATRITLSNFIKNININKNPVTVYNDDYFSDFKTMTHKVNHTNYPVRQKHPSRRKRQQSPPPRLPRRQTCRRLRPLPRRNRPRRQDPLLRLRRRRPPHNVPRLPQATRDTVRRTAPRCRDRLRLPPPATVQTAPQAAHRPAHGPILPHPPAQDSTDRKSTRLNSSHTDISRMPSSA